MAVDGSQFAEHGAASRLYGQHSASRQIEACHLWRPYLGLVDWRVQSSERGDIFGLEDAQVVEALGSLRKVQR